MVKPNVIKSAVKRERGAFKIIYESCTPYAFSIVRRYVSDANIHKDIIQEIFARLFLSLDSFDESKSFKPWFRRIVINQCMEYLRKNHKMSVVIPLTNTTETPSENLEAELTKLSKSEIEMLLAKMPDGYRQVFMLVAIDDYTHKEVGALLDITMLILKNQHRNSNKFHYFQYYIYPFRN